MSVINKTISTSSVKRPYNIDLAIVASNKVVDVKNGIVNICDTVTFPGSDMLPVSPAEPDIGVILAHRVIFD